MSFFELLLERLDEPSERVAHENAIATSSRRASSSSNLRWSRPFRQRALTDHIVASATQQQQRGSNSSASDSDGNFYLRHAMHRRRLYVSLSRQLSQYSDSHHFYKLMMWCHANGVFIHPAIRMERHLSAFRDHIFTVNEDVPRLTPLLAIPESLVIGFKNSGYRDASDSHGAESVTNNLHDEKKEKEFHAASVGEGESDADICAFFFDCLGMIVADLVTARSSPLTDPRYLFAESLGRVRTMQNAPYFGDDVVFDSNETSLPDVLLQMIRNYINGGPLVTKLDRGDLKWAVSVCLSHSTPLPIGTMRSIGIIPVAHLFPHGGSETNSVIIARNGRRDAEAKLASFFAHHSGIDLMPSRRGAAAASSRSVEGLVKQVEGEQACGALESGRWIYLVPTTDIPRGGEIKVQAMAPVCEKDAAAHQMWRLSCGDVPDSFVSSYDMAAMRDATLNEILDRGGDLLAKDRA